jgi:hypothetical protein
MRDNHHQEMKAIYKAQLAFAIGLTGLSFGAACKAERAEALVKEVENPTSRSFVIDRESVYTGLRNFYAATAVTAGLMAGYGLLRGRKT